MKVPKIKLKKGQEWKDYIAKNEKNFWDMTINAIELLSKNPDLDNYTAFILHGGKLPDEKEFVVQREDIDTTISKALNKMEELEEYETCARLVELKKNFE